MPAATSTTAVPASGAHLRLFGPVGLVSAGRPIAVPVRKSLALLVYLALQGKASRSSLSTLFWPDLDEATARHNLRHAVYRLRVAGLGSVLQVDNEQVAISGLSHDLEHFEQALAEADPARALALRTGILCEGLVVPDAPAFNDWLVACRERFVRAWRAAASRHAQRLQAAGDLDAALVVQQQLMDDDLLHESTCLDLMRLHALRGDSAAALLTYERLAEALLEQLGVAPSQPLQALALTLREPVPQAVSQVVSDAPSDTVMPMVPVRLAQAMHGLPTQVPFIARVAAQAKLEAALSQGQRVYLHGVAGSGKTRLACELAAARGAWLRVACEPQDAELPYSSIVRLLRAAHHAAPDVALPDWVRRELAQLMPELGTPPDNQATDEARLRLLAAVAECWRLLVHDNFSAVVLDDWHWGDSASVALWAGLDDPATGPRSDMAVAWIISHRSAQLPAAALQRLRADVDSGRGVAVELDGMSAHEVLALTQALSGSGGAQLFSQRLQQATAGNPFFLLETLRHLFEQGLLVASDSGWSTPFDDLTQDYAELPIPDSVHGAVLARTRALGRQVQQQLELASLCHGSIDARLLAGASGEDEAAVVEALEHARAAQLLHELAGPPQGRIPEGEARRSPDELPGQDTGWRFAHDLVRQALQRSLSSGRKRLLHERLARQLEQAAAEPALVAAQWESARQPAAALRWRIAAAEAALRVHALTEALSQYAQALAHGARGEAAARIHLARAQLQARQGDHGSAEASFAAAVEAAGNAPAALPSADTGGDPCDVLLIHLVRAEYLIDTDRFDAARDLLQALAPQLTHSSPARRSRALGATGALLVREGRHNEGQVQLQQALELLEPLPQARAQQAALLLEMMYLCQRRGERAQGAQLARRAVALHQAIHATHGLVLSLAQLGSFQLEAGEHEAGLAACEQARELAQRCGLVQAQRAVIVILVEQALGAGDIDRALQLLDEGDALAPIFEKRQTELNFFAARCYALQMRGELEPARAAAERLLAAAAQLAEPMLRLVYLQIVVELHLLSGDTGSAAQLVAEAQMLSDAFLASSEGNTFTHRQEALTAWLALSQGQFADALALLPEGAGLGEDVRDRFEAAWIGCAAARGVGDLAQAHRRLHTVGLEHDVGGNLMAFWLEQSLGLAVQVGQADPASVHRARSDLASGKVPPLLAQRLRDAVEAASSLGS